MNLRVSSVLICSFLVALQKYVLALGAQDPANPALSSPCHPLLATPEQCLAKMDLNQKIGQMTQIANIFLKNDLDIATLGLGSMLSGGGAGPAGAGGTAVEWADMVDKYQSLSLKSDLKIPLLYAADSVHGHNNIYGATIFPHNIALGAANEPDLARRIAEATRFEMLSTGVRWTFAPCVAVTRDDRWGRAYESFSENKTLVSILGEHAVIGYQNGALGVTDHTGVLAGTKHYLGDGGTLWGTGDTNYPIDQGNVVAPDEAFVRDMHLFPYQAAVAAGVASMVVSYNSINDVKMHGNGYWITDVLKKEMGFKGIVVSDWRGVDQINPDYGTSVRTAINAGLDMVMVPDRPFDFIGTLRAEVEAGRVPMSRIDDAVLRILRAKHALQLWDYPFANRTLLDTVGSAPHRALAREAAVKSMVLLQNDMPPGQFPLPLAPGASYTIAVAGKSADDVGNQCGGWTISWQGASGATTLGTTVLQGIKDTVATISDANITVQHVIDPFDAFSADIGIAVVGEVPYAEGVGDNGSLELEGRDLDAIYNVCEKSTKCIVVIISGRPLIITDHLPTADVWIAAWLPGTEGAAVADVLFGVQPFTGTLPVTWPLWITQVPANFDDGTDVDALYQIGHGLKTVEPGGIAAAESPLGGNGGINGTAFDNTTKTAVESAPAPAPAPAPAAENDDPIGSVNVTSAAASATSGGSEGMQGKSALRAVVQLLFIYFIFTR